MTPVSSEQKLRGRTALVTGASRGIGQAIAKALAVRGAQLLVTGTTQASASQALAALPVSEHKHHAFAADFAQPDAAKALAREALETLGGVDLLVNNAGTIHIAPWNGTTDDDLRRVLEVNLVAPYALTRALLPHMVERRSGRIVNISSISGTLGTPRLSSYCASKWGLNGLTRALAEELKGSGVFIAAVMPGSVDTDMLRSVGFPPAMQPEDIAKVVDFLCTEAPLSMQGSLLEVFG